MILFKIIRSSKLNNSVTVTLLAKTVSGTWGLQGQNHGIHHPEAHGTLWIATTAPLQSGHQVSSSPHHQGGLQSHSQGNLCLETGQSSPSQEAYHLEVVHQEETTRIAILQTIKTSHQQLSSTKVTSTISAILWSRTSSQRGWNWNWRRSIHYHSWWWKICRTKSTTTRF